MIQSNMRHMKIKKKKTNTQNNMKQTLNSIKHEHELNMYLDSARTRATYIHIMLYYDIAMYNHV